MQDEDEAAFLAGADATPAPETPPAEPEKATEASPEAEAKPEAAAAPEEAETPPEEPEKPKQTPWFQKRIDELTREKYDERRANEQLRQELAAFRQFQTEGGPQEATAPQPTPDEIRAQVKFDMECDAIAQKGEAEFADFAQALLNFRLLGGLHPAVIRAAMATDAPHQVLYELGRNPEDAGRILSLAQADPIRMAAEVVKVGMRSVTPPAPKVSRAPEPVKPVGGNGRAEKDPMSDDAPIDAWMKAHDEREAGRRASR